LSLDAAADKQTQPILSRERGTLIKVNIYARRAAVFKKYRLSKPTETGAM